VALTAERPPVAAGEAFDALLRALHPQRDTAAERYEEMRRRLRRFFVWRGTRWPDELTDETIDRVGRRLAGGETIRAADVGRYFLGVARNVLREAWEQERQRGPEHGVSVLAERLPAPPAAAERQEARLDCLERCLAELGADSRELVLRYYEGEGAAKIAGRRALAARLGVAPPTLRIRLHRLRARLEACVQRCLASRETSVPGAPPSGEGRRQ
jgi:DNA-directed RNA polymerase specialized sigma24 family protein